MNPHESSALPPRVRLRAPDNQGEHVSKFHDLIAVGAFLALAATACSSSQDSEVAELEQRIAELEASTSTNANSISQPTSTTVATTTSTEPTTDPADVALRYFRALYAKDFELASSFSVAEARNYATFNADLDAIRPLHYIPALDLGAERDVTLERGTIEYCVNDLATVGASQCFVASGFALDDSDRLSSFDVDGQPIDSLVLGPLRLMTADYSVEGDVLASRPAVPGVAYGDSRIDENKVEFVIRPKWIAETPIQSVVVMELSTSIQDTTRPNSAWLIPETTLPYVEDVSSLFPLGYQDGRPIALPFATVSGVPPEAFNVGVTTADSTLYELRYRSGTSMRTIDLKLAPFLDIAEDYRIKVQSGAVTIATELLPMSPDDLIEESLEGCAPINVDNLVKQPENGRGVCFEAYGVIFQFDSNTGSCAFLADIGQRKSTRSYDYTDTAWFGFGSDPNQFDQVQDCSMLDGVDQNDFIQVWATGAGTLTYTSAIGSTLTVPAMSIIKIDVYRKG